MFIGACVAPFLLLRTDESTKRAQDWAVWASNNLEDLGSHEFIEGAFFFATLFLARPVCILLNVMRHPLQSIRSIPQNWARIVFASDAHHPPEFIPDCESMEGSYAFKWSTWSDQMLSVAIHSWKEDSFFYRILIPVAVVMVFILFFGPALFYRYSVKASAIVYLPILWILHDSLVERSQFRLKLEEIAESPIEQLKRWYSAFVLIFHRQRPCYGQSQTHRQAGKGTTLQRCALLLQSMRVRSELLRSRYAELLTFARKERAA